MLGRRQFARQGAVIEGATPLTPYLVVDQAGAEIAPVNRYLRDRMLGDVSPLTCRSYAHDLLRWFRLLWLLEVAWDRATEAETAVLVGWLRNAVTSCVPHLGQTLGTDPRRTADELQWPQRGAERRQTTRRLHPSSAVSHPDGETTTQHVVS
ncbi:hypothetical protein [Kutzneria sp. 744]|uniref:hypothetical protein n=1 Tax=Kutzneria sp. (strain 744) TaxID=345341 RepID=UPI0018DD06D5|nr:hypothetical protein [Kutzneria sp. 744]